jgi:vacuolar-type H+-ATPase subunit H
MSAPQRIQVVKPDPDPTLLTTESLLREISHLRELTEEKFKTQTVRTDSLENRLDHKYGETADAIRNLRDLHEEKFEGLDKLGRQAREDNQTRLDAAFKSANDTRDKIEESLTKQIDALNNKTEAANKATNEKIDRLTSRLDTGEGKTKGAGDLWGYLVGLIGVLVAATALFLKH